MGLSPRTVLYVHAILHTALRDALRWNRIVRNPADAAMVPAEASARSPERGTWTAEQLDAFLDFVGPTRYLAPWFFLGTSGCRRGEGLGLKRPRG
jgi:integrase